MKYLQTDSRVIFKPRKKTVKENCVQNNLYFLKVTLFCDCYHWTKEERK